jgi:excisionase family DNA binding protein
LWETREALHVKVELQIDTQEFVAAISKVLLKELKPLLERQTVHTGPLFTVKTLAKYLEVSDQWVYERVHLKEIPYLKVGKFPRFKKSDIDKWLDTLKIPAAYPLSNSGNGRLPKGREHSH